MLFFSDRSSLLSTILSFYGHSPSTFQWKFMNVSNCKSFTEEVVGRRLTMFTLATVTFSFSDSFLCLHLVDWWIDSSFVSVSSGQFFPFFSFAPETGGWFCCPDGLFPLFLTCCRHAELSLWIGLICHSCSTPCHARMNIQLF